MVVQHNLTAMNSNRMLNITVGKQKKSTEKLSSGYRINRAADDAAGLAISEKMRKQIRGLRQGEDNIQDGISACQIMDGALTETHDILHRMNELSVKAANGTLSTDDREAIQAEMNQLVTELDRISSTTKFNETYLLGVPAPKTEAEPIYTSADIVFIIDNTSSMGGPLSNVKTNLSSFVNGLGSVNTRYAVVEYGEIHDGAVGNPKIYDFADTEADTIANLDKITLTGGGDGPESALEGIMAALEGLEFRTGAAKEFILVTDADYHTNDKTVCDTGCSSGTPCSALNVSDVVDAYTEKGVRLSAIINTSYRSDYDGTLANGLILDIGSSFADSLKTLASRIKDDAGVDEEGEEDIPPIVSDMIRIQVSGEVTDATFIHRYNVSAKTLGVHKVKVTTAESATETIDKVAEAIKRVSDVRSRIGAEQNGLEHALRNNENVRENTTAAESQIRDTDMAAEMVLYSNNNILAQAGQSMLAQANQVNQAVLSLLQ